MFGSSKKKKKSHNKTPVPESSVHSVKKASTQNRLARSPRSCFTTLQLYTSAVSEHKTHYRAAGRVDRQQSVSAGQTHTGAVITNLILMQNKFFLFLFLIIKTDKYTHTVCSCKTWNLVNPVPPPVRKNCSGCSNANESLDWQIITVPEIWRVTAHRKPGQTNHCNHLKISSTSSLLSEASWW